MDWFLYDNDLRHERVKNKKCNPINPFHATSLFPYPLQITENLWSFQGLLKQPVV